MISQTAGCGLCGSTVRPLWEGRRPAYHCAGCGVVSTPRPAAPLVPEKHWSGDYYERYYRPRAEALIADFGRYLDDLPGQIQPGSWLDVGCGGGFFAAAALQRGWSVTGVDPSAEALGLAAEIAPGARLVQGCATELPADEQFDAISFWDSMSVIPDLAGVLQNCIARLRPGGTLLVKNPNRPLRYYRALQTCLGWRPALRDDLCAGDVTCWHLCPSVLAGLLRRQGLEIVRQSWVREVPGEREELASLSMLGREALRRTLLGSIGPHQSFLLVARRG